MIRKTTMLPLLALAPLLAVTACGPGDKARDKAADVPVRTIPTIAPSIAPATQDPAAAQRFRTFDGIDTDGDGYISPAENAAAADNVFDAIDADGDGSITVDELNAARAALHLAPTPNSAAVIARADQDGDGRLTLAEWIAMRGQDFRAVDKDGDGRLSRAEWQTMFRIGAAAAPVEPKGPMSPHRPAGR